MSGALFPPCCLIWGQVMVEVMKIMTTSSKGPLQALLQSMPQMLQQATTNPHLCFRLLDTPGQVWISLLWCHCSFLLGPGAHKLFFVSSMSLLPQSCVSSYSSMARLVGTSSKRAYAIPKSTIPRAPAPAAVQWWPLPPQKILKHSSGSISVWSLGPGVHKVCLSSLSISGWHGVWF